MRKAEGVYYNDITRDLNRQAYNKTKRTIDMCDKWRKACVADPTLPYKITFAKFKKNKGQVADVSAENHKDCSPRVPKG